MQSVGSSAEFGNVQGAVINVVTRQGSERFLSDLAYYGQTAALTSQPVTRPSESVHQEFGANPDPPTAVTRFDATLRRSTSVPAITFGHLTHAVSTNTVWDVRVGRFAYRQDSLPSTGVRLNLGR